MNEAPRTLIHRISTACGRTFAMAAIALMVPFAAPAFADQGDKAPITDAADKPSDDPLEGVNLNDAPLGPTSKTKKGRRPAPAPAPNKPGRSGGTKSN